MRCMAYSLRPGRFQMRLFFSPPFCAFRKGAGRSTKVLQPRVVADQPRPPFLPLFFFPLLSFVSAIRERGPPSIHSDIPPSFSFRLAAAGGKAFLDLSQTRSTNFFFPHPIVCAGVFLAAVLREAGRPFTFRRCFPPFSFFPPPLSPPAEGRAAGLWFKAVWDTV